MEICIRTTASSQLHGARTSRKTGSKSKIAQLRSQFKRKPVRRRALRVGFIALNALILAGISMFVLQARTSDATALLSSVASDEAVSNPLDEVSSADIAVTVSRLSGMVESTAIKNQSESDAVQLASASISNNVVAKPQVSVSSFKSNKDIKTYTVVAGDTVASIAAKFNVTSDSIKWSNSLTGESVTVGSTLKVPPAGMNGIVYIVRAGDTIDSIAAKYSADKTQLIAANDAEIAGITEGQQIIIPGGQQPVQRAVAAATTTTATASYSSGFAFGSVAMYGYNGYDYGYCTWYVANRIGVPANWGNANTWDNFAPGSGWTVSQTPRVGAVAQTNRGGEGHVGVVEAVSEDGSMIKYSDMNGIAGWGRTGYSDWVPTIGHFQNFIYR